MVIIGLVGSICSGKETLANELSKRSFHVIKINKQFDCSNILKLWIEHRPILIYPIQTQT